MTLDLIVHVYKPTYIVLLIIDMCDDFGCQYQCDVGKFGHFYKPYCICPSGYQLNPDDEKSCQGQSSTSAFVLAHYVLL